MRKTKKNCFPNLKSLLKKLKGGMAPVTWGETYKQPSEDVMQHATTAGGRHKHRTRHKHRKHRIRHTRRKQRKQRKHN